MHACQLGIQRLTVTPFADGNFNRISVFNQYLEVWVGTREPYLGISINVASQRHIEVIYHLRVGPLLRMTLPELSHRMW